MMLSRSRPAPGAPNLLFTRPCLTDITCRGITTCEILRQSPHPNVCDYCGADVQGGLVYELMFDRYDMTLGEAIDTNDAQRLNITRCVQDIETGISYIHSLGMVHCGIKPENVIVDLWNERFVVGDFDSVHREGERLRLKTGTSGWVPLEGETRGLARYAIDWYSLGVIRKWLEIKIARGRDGHVSDERYRTTNILAAANEGNLDGVSEPVAAGPAVQELGDDIMDTSW
jgi:serine/threonine protein kinase